MRFFIPSVSKPEIEPTYLEMQRSLIDQLRLTIQTRRIFKLSYVDGKKTLRVEVGQPKPQENHYIAAAIFEASVFVVINQTRTGGPGPIVLIDKAQVIQVEEFL